MHNNKIKETGIKLGVFQGLVAPAPHLGRYFFELVIYK